MLFIVVEDRVNTTLQCCVRSAELAGETLLVIRETESPDYERFKALYRHKSPNPEDFELICFRRYFLLNDHCRANPDIACFVLIDSDVMLFRDASRHMESRASDLAFLGSLAFESNFNEMQISPHCSYWRRDSIAAFVLYLLEKYADPAFFAVLDRIVADFETHRRIGGISDMTLLCLWAATRNDVDYANRLSPFGTADHNVNMAFNGFDESYQRRFGWKVITFDGGSPFLSSDTTKQKAVLLHFQGHAKKLMPYALDRSTMKFVSGTVRFAAAARWAGAKRSVKGVLQSLRLWRRL